MKHISTQIDLLGYIGGFFLDDFLSDHLANKAEEHILEHVALRAIRPVPSIA